jgi:YegS/Rv2252/BmrU family lipid kinase
MKKLFFIINPMAGNGGCLKVWNQVEAKLKDACLSFDAVLTEYPGHAKNIAEKIIIDHPGKRLFLIAVGGDGTLSEVVNGIAGSKNSKVGFIPGGSGNDFSRGFHVPSDPIEALNKIIYCEQNEAANIDIGKITMNDQSTHYFINNMGAGFDALISYKANRSRMKSFLNRLGLGSLVYVYFLIKLLFTYRRSSIVLVIDGIKHRFDDSWFVTVSNQPFYGGGMKIAPAAVPDDGLLDITVVHKLSKLKLLFVFISVFKGKHTRFKEVSAFKGRKISIHSSSTLFVHADGEFIGHTPLDIELLEGQLSIASKY